MLINTSFRGLASWLALLPVLVLSVFLSACGGGGGGSSNAAPTTNQVKIHGNISVEANGKVVVLRDEQGSELASGSISNNQYEIIHDLSVNKHYMLSFDDGEDSLSCVISAHNQEVVCNLNPVSTIKAGLYKKLGGNIDLSNARVRKYFHYFDANSLEEFQYKNSQIEKNLEELSISLDKNKTDVINMVVDDINSGLLSFSRLLQQHVVLDSGGVNEFNSGEEATVQLLGINNLSDDYKLTWSNLPVDALPNGLFGYVFSSAESAYYDVTAKLYDKDGSIVLSLMQPIYFNYIGAAVDVVPDDVGKPFTGMLNEKLAITIPEGDMLSSEKITFKNIESKNPEKKIGFTLEPSGKVFDKPLTLQYFYDPREIEDPRQLQVIRKSEDGEIVSLKIAAIDYINHSISFQTEHFSEFYVIDKWANEYVKDKTGIDLAKNDDLKIFKWKTMQDLLLAAAKSLHEQGSLDKTSYEEIQQDIKNPDSSYSVLSSWKDTLNKEIMDGYGYTYWDFLKDNYPLYAAYRKFSALELGDKDYIERFQPDTFAKGSDTIDLMNVYVYLYGNSNIGGKSPDKYGFVDKIFRINDVYYSDEFKRLNLNYPTRLLEDLKVKTRDDLKGKLIDKVPGLGDALKNYDRIVSAFDDFAGFFNDYADKTGEIKTVDDYFSFMAFGQVNSSYYIKLVGTRDFTISRQVGGETKVYKYSDGQVKFQYNTIAGYPVQGPVEYKKDGIAYINLAYQKPMFHKMYSILYPDRFFSYDAGTEKSLEIRVIDFYYSIKSMMDALMVEDGNAYDQTLKLKPVLMKDVTNTLLQEGQRASKKVEAVILQYAKYKGVNVKTWEEIKAEKIQKYLLKGTSGKPLANRTLQKNSALKVASVNVQDIVELPTISTFENFLNINSKVESKAFSEFLPEKIEIYGQKSAVNHVQGNDLTTEDVLTVDDVFTEYSYVKKLTKDMFTLNSGVYSVSLKMLFSNELLVSDFDNTYNNIKVKLYYSYKGRQSIEEKSYEFGVSQMSYVYKKYSLSVVVKDATTNLPIEGAKVSLSPGVHEVTETNVEGAALFDSVVPNNYLVSVSKDDYIYSEGTYLISDGDQLEYVNDVFLYNKLTDSDSDGLPDYWENQYGLNPNDPSDALMDMDNDGYSNLDEFKGGSLPNDGSDIPKRSSIVSEEFNSIPNAVTSPNGGENWSYGTTETVKWNNSYITGSTVDLYVLHDAPDGLDQKASSTLGAVVNQKNWYKFAENVPNTGSYSVDPQSLNGVGNAYRVLIVSTGDNTKWDISDGNFSLVNVSSLGGQVLFGIAAVPPNVPFYGVVEAHSGNAPYKFIIDWGDGSPTDTHENTLEVDGYARQSIEHSYASEGQYHLVVVASDDSGQSTTFTNTITVATGYAPSQWQVDVHDVVPNTSETIDFTSTSVTSNGNSVGQYSTAWSPSSGSNEYFVKYSLPVPPGLIQLGKKVRLRSLVKASDIPDYDREFAFKTNKGIEYTASIRDINNPEGGYLRKRDLNTGAVDRLVYPVMVDDVKNTKFYGYDIEMGTSDFSIWRQSDNKKLASYYDNVADSYLSEIDLTFKGNGEIQLTLLEYDRNGDGTFGTDERLILNTVNKTVDWSLFGNGEPPVVSDAGLKACINEALGLAADVEPSTSQLLSLTELNCEGRREISDISALSALMNLQYLNLATNQISDISALHTLMNLQYLNLAANQVSDISALSALMNLRYLDLAVNQVSDISALSGLVNLKGLYLDTNEISDIGVLSNLVNLQFLTMISNKISDVSVLSGLVNLEWLELSYNQISDIRALSVLVNLTGLYLHTNQISDISALSGLVNLTWLDLSYNQISNISALSNLVNLWQLLDLDDNQISDISALSSLVNLQILELDSNQISDINGISSLASLQVLHLASNQISDINELSGLINLQWLSLASNQISDVSILSGLPNLQGVQLEHNCIPGEDLQKSPDECGMNY